MTSIATKAGNSLLALVLLLPIASGAQDALIERGRYLATAANCAACHSRPDGAPFAGGVPFVTPMGTIYSTNITPDPDIGIGGWSAADLRRALHEGIAPSGRHLFPAFPYPSFTRISDEDADAIYAYLRSLEPQRYAPPPNGLLFRQRWAMRLWNLLFFEPGRFTGDPAKPEEWNRGAYLVEGPGHCSACHTPRNAFLAERKSEAFRGGVVQQWSAVDLGPEGLAAWSVEDLAKYLRQGFSAKAGTFGPMNEVIVGSLSQLSPEDVHAMAVYLKALPARQRAPGPVPSAEEIAAGQPIYKKHCESCHGGSGRGGMFSGPPLAGSAIVQSDNPASLINVILQGANVPPGVRTGSWETMKPFREALSDGEIASLANFLRGSWSNHARPVSVSEVGRQR